MEKSTVAALRDAFNAFDTNGDGAIDMSELHGILNGIGIQHTTAELRELLSMMDTSKDGQIDFEEFMSAISAKLSTIDATEFVDIAYDSFDRDRDNKIGSGDLRQVFDEVAGDMDVTDDEIKAIVETYGKGRGCLSKAQFKVWMNGSAA